MGCLPTQTADSAALSPGTLTISHNLQSFWKTWNLKTCSNWPGLSCVGVFSRGVCACVCAPAIYTSFLNIELIQQK